MVARVIVASLLASVLWFMWGYVFWGLSGIPVATGMMAPLPNELDGTASVKARTVFGELKTGVYAYPFPPPSDGDEATIAAFANRYEAGPLMHIFYQQDGGPAMPPTQFLFGWLHMFGLCLGFGLLLMIVRTAVPTFASRFAVVALVGLIAATMTNVGSAIWFHHPWPYQLGSAAYDLVGALIAAVVLAAMVRFPQSQSQS